MTEHQPLQHGTDMGDWDFQPRWARNPDVERLAIRGMLRRTAQVLPSERTARIMVLRDGGAAYRAIGEAFGISTERARQIVKQYELRCQTRSRRARP